MSEPKEPKERTHGHIEEWLRLEGLSPQTVACLRSIVHRRELMRRDARVIIPHDDPLFTSRAPDLAAFFPEDPPDGGKP